MKIEFIQYPYLFTDTGARIEIDTVDGVPRVGAEIVPAVDDHNYIFKVLSVTVDTECVGGVCPTR